MERIKRQTTTTINNTSMTNCHKGGIKIKEAGNEYKMDPFAGINPFSNSDEEKNFTVIYDKTSYEKLDLNINNYSREELFKLFGLKTMSLNLDIIKECRKTVFKTHPDKSRLDEKYFIFFSKAYKKLLEIYEFQNKNNQKVEDTNNYFDNENNIILDKLFETKKDLKKTENFNAWFNEQFEKNKLEDSNEKGYGSWLESDADIVYTPDITKDKFAFEMEKRKREVQSLTTYNGVNDHYASTFGGSSLMSYDSNFSSNSLFGEDGIGYTDLRQAYVESVIPVTEDDFNKAQKFNNLDEYKNHRESQDTKPMDKETAMRKLFEENKKNEEESAALAFYYAQQHEKTEKNQETFWSSLKQLTNF
jgi:hypothetical protein